MTYGIGDEQFDCEGRVICAEFPEFYLVTVYTPNAQKELVRIDFRMAFEDKFRAYLERLHETKPVIVCGDMNVAHRRIDIKNAKPNMAARDFRTKKREVFRTARGGFCGFVPRIVSRCKGRVFLVVVYGQGEEEKNVGWRIDYFLITEELKKNLADSKILSDVMGSNHFPVELILNFSEENA